MVSYAWDWEEGYRSLLGDKVDWSDHRVYDDEVCGQVSTSRKSGICLYTLFCLMDGAC